MVYLEESSTEEYVLYINASTESADAWPLTNLQINTLTPVLTLTGSLPDNTKYN